MRVEEINQLSREEIKKELENRGFAVYETETYEDLKEALKEEIEEARK